MIMIMIVIKIMIVIMKVIMIMIVIMIVIMIMLVIMLVIVTNRHLYNFSVFLFFRTFCDNNVKYLYLVSSTARSRYKTF